MTVFEGLPCPNGAGTVSGGRWADVSCPACGQSFRIQVRGGSGALPRHAVEPSPRPPQVVHRNSGYPPAAAAGSACALCSDCRHAPDDDNCLDGCFTPSAGSWLPLEGAWACDACSCPVVGPDTKALMLAGAMR